MKTFYAVALFVIFMARCGADDIRSKVGQEPGQKATDAVIDPDKSIFGVPSGTTEDEFIAKHGEPVGYMRLNGNTTAMLYGTSTAFLFKKDKLAGVLVANNTVDHRLLRTIPDARFPDHTNWELSNGIKSDMTLADARKAVGTILTPKTKQRHFQQYFTEKSQVEIFFMRSNGTPEDDENAYKAVGVFVTPKKEKP
jgi:hypothetical protein